jgi:hypothetical protein
MARKNATAQPMKWRFAHDNARVKLKKLYKIAVGVTESRNRPAVDEFLNAHRFAVLVINKINFREAHQHGFAVNQFIFNFYATTDNLLGWNAIVRKPRTKLAATVEQQSRVR